MAMYETDHQARSERITASLPTELARRLRAEAREQERSVAAVVREALETYLAGRPAPELPSFAGVGNSGIRDLSERDEELLARAVHGRAPE